MFAKILNANDGSETGFRSFTMAVALAKENGVELNMVCVEEIPYMPEFVQEVEEQNERTARRIEGLLKHAQAVADAEQVKLKTHVLKGHPVRDIVRLAEELKVDLLVIGAVEAWKAVRDPLGRRFGDVWAQTQVVDGKVVSGSQALARAQGVPVGPERWMTGNADRSDSSGGH